MELWYTEHHTANVGLSLRIKKTIFSAKSQYQDVTVLDTVEFGRMLLLDGLVMTTERDEFMYHELIVHPALFTHASPRKVLIIGGGDGGTVREVTSHTAVSDVVLCEIDPMVVDVSRQYLPSISCKLDDPRVSIVFTDGIEFVSQHRSEFDLIIVDSTDPIGPAKGLFELEFYRSCIDCLKEDGILVCQSESPIYHLDIIADMHQLLHKSGFPIVRFYYGIVPTYPGGMWSWVIASKKYDPLSDVDLDEIKKSNIKTRYYNSRVHNSIFNLPEFFSLALK